MPAVSKKQQRFFGMVRAAQKGEGATSPEVAKVADEISNKDAKKFAKTKHKGLPEKKKMKEETSTYEKLKKKKYQGVNESVQNNKVDLILKTDVNNVLKQDNKDYDRGLLAKVNKDGSYDVAYWYDEYKAYPVEVVIDGKSIKKDAKNIHIKYHPELKKKNKEEAKDAMKEETSMRKKRDVTKSKPKAPQFDAAKELVINAPYMKPALQQREGTSYKTFMSDVQSAKDRLKKKVEDRKKKDAQFVDTKQKGVRFFDKKGKGRIVKGRKIYD